MVNRDRPRLEIRGALARATRTLEEAGKPHASMDAEVLLAAILGGGRDLFFREPERLLTPDQFRKFEILVGRRAAGEPLQYLTGVQEFWSIPFRVDGRVLIPRPETEFLVQAALDRLPQEIPAEVLDLGTGSGIIAVSLATERALLKVVASDICSGALALAALNSRTAGVHSRIQFVCGDLFAPFRALPGWDLIAVNPPYVASGTASQLADEVRLHEPPQALYAGPLGIEILDKIVNQAQGYLSSGGWLLLEVGDGQWPAVEEMAVVDGGWETIEWVRDLSGIRRVACLERGKKKRPRI